jgi:NADH:ubiquinone oxidoreductase subunit E
MDIRGEQALVDEFPQDQREAIDTVLKKYRGRPGALIPVLKDIQDITGYLPLVLQRKIAEGLNLPLCEVFGVVTFYSFFNMQPKGRHGIKVCLGTACYARGNKALIDTVKHELQCEVGATTEDRRFTLEAVRCLGCCGIAPVVNVDKDTYGYVGAKEIRPILDRYE